MEREATGLLEPKRRSNRGRPAWLYGVRLTDRRDPHGVVLMLGTWNYPLFLTGTQTLQALVAGNAVLVKPGRGAHAAAVAIRDLLREAGLPPGVLAVLGEEVEAGEAAVDAGVNKVVLTGSASTGRAVLRKLRRRASPPRRWNCPGATRRSFWRGRTWKLAAKCLALSLTMNGSATCVAARRVFVHESLSERTAGGVIEAGHHDRPRRLRPGGGGGGRRTDRGRPEPRGDPPMRDARPPVPDPPRAMPVVLADVPGRADILHADCFAPVLSLIEVSGTDEARARDNCCPYALGATVFGPPAAARRTGRRHRRRVRGRSTTS